MKTNKKIYMIAKKIDRLSDSKGRCLNRNEVSKMLKDFNPKFIGNGGWKRVFRLGKRKFYAFKVGNPRDIKLQNEIYKHLKGKRKIGYAKIYWSTKYCQLQRFCTIVKLTEKELKLYQYNAKEFGYYDARASNLGKCKGRIVAFDLMPRKVNLTDFEKKKNTIRFELAIAPGLLQKDVRKQLIKILKKKGINMRGEK